MAFSPKSPNRAPFTILHRAVFASLVFTSACATLVDIHEPILIDEQNAAGGSATSSSGIGSSGSGGMGGNAGGSMSNGGSGGSGGALNLGAPCASGDQCASTFCVDGVCCNNDCSGKCDACIGEYKGDGVDGQCGPIAVGIDPDNECQNGVCAGGGNTCFSTPFDPTKWYKFKNESCGKLIDVGGPTMCNWTCDGQNVQLWVDYGGDRQAWRIRLVDKDQYQIINKYSGKGLDVEAPSGGDGANIHQWTYVGNANQKWRMTDVGSGYIKLESVNSGKVMQVASNTCTDGTNIEQWSYKSAPDDLYQKWIILEVP